MYGEISIYQIRIYMRYLAANISSPKVRELHDHFLWRERALQKYLITKGQTTRQREFYFFPILNILSIVLPTVPNSTSAPFQANLLSTPKCIQDLLAEFPDVASSDGFTASKPRHGVKHHLLTQPGPPVFARAR